MQKSEYETSVIDEKINRLEKNQVIKNYYLVLGGGKIGTNFLQYARKNKFPFVLVIDRDENAPASREAYVIKTEDELVDLLKSKASALLPDETLGSPGATGENEREDRGEIRRGNGEPDSVRGNGERQAYFYKMDLENTPFLLNLGIPEYIIPAVPCHAVAYMLPDLLKLPLEAGKNENPEETQNKSQKESRPVTELFIRPENERFMAFFEKLAASFPEDVIAGRYPEYGMLFFSYAREGEVCTDGCPGPRDRCPTFGRIKPETITEYAGKLRRNLPGWVFESHQMKPGIGGLKGRDFKRNLLEILEFSRKFKANTGGERFENLEDRTFFVATTCTCHGVLNLFYVI
jgi:hypothetical protein